VNTEPTPPNSETVSQSDVEGLLTQIGGTGSPSLAPAAALDQYGSQPHVFRRLSSFSPSELRKLRLRHENFVRSLAARLSVHLRLEVGLKINRLDSMPFEKLLKEFSNPTYLALLKLEPLKGTCLLEIPPQISGSLVDRELGGPGHCLEEDRALTEIESRIISRIVEMMIGEWCLTWSDLLDLRPVLAGHESTGTSTQNHSLDTIMLVIGVEMQIGDLTKPIHFAFPYSTLEPLIQKLSVETREDAQPVAKAAPKLPKWNPVHDDINIKVTAELPGLKVKAEELGKLKPGDVITLEPEIFHHVRVCLEKKPKFIATAGKCGALWAAKVTKILDSGAA